MSRRSQPTAIALVLVGVTLLAGATLPVAGSTPPPPPGTLTQSGGWIRDASGRVVILHGTNAVWMTGPEYVPPTDKAVGLTAADAALMRDLGFNVVRLGWIWKGLAPQRYTIDEDYLDRLVAAARVLTGAGIYVLVESHQDMYNERYQGEGAPDWATNDDGLPVSALGFPGNYMGPATSRAFDNLWTNRDGLWQDYAMAWRAVAERFAGEPNILGYDLFNEPWPGSQWPSCVQPAGCPAFDRGFLQPFLDNTARAVRYEDPHHIVFYEPHVLFNFGVASSLGPPAIPGPVGLSFHDYCINRETRRTTGVPELQEATAPACPAMDDIVQMNARSAADSMGAARLLTEFGSSFPLADLDRYLDLADRSLVGWIYWEYKAWKGSKTVGLFSDNSDLSTLYEAKARLLSRTYPVAIAGEPVSWSFDPDTKEFLLEYTADPSVTAPTVVYVPVDRQYKGSPFIGYTVVATGATVLTTDPEATYVELENDPGASTVTVRIRGVTDPA